MPIKNLKSTFSFFFSVRLSILIKIKIFTSNAAIVRKASMSISLMLKFLKIGAPALPITNCQLPIPSFPHVTIDLIQ